jgi:phage gp46-like protein
MVAVASLSASFVAYGHSALAPTITSTQIADLPCRGARMQASLVRLLANVCKNSGKRNPITNRPTIK